MANKDEFVIINNETIVLPLTTNELSDYHQYIASLPVEVRMSIANFESNMTGQRLTLY